MTADDPHRALAGEVDVVACAVDDARLDALLQSYMREWATLISVPVGDDGRYHYTALDGVDAVLLIQTPELPAVVDEVVGEVIGFALTKSDARAIVHMQEFYVVDDARRRGVGARAARALVARTTATWTWTVRPENPGALAFWRRAFPNATESVEHDVTKDNIARARFTLLSKER